MILHLTLKRQWFVQIANGIKKIEFREKKPYWQKRLFRHRWTEIHFRNGYGKDCPFMRVEFKGIESLPPGISNKEYYCIRLGDVLEIRDAPFLAEREQRGKEV